RAYLRDQLRAMGYEVVEQPFDVSIRPALNLEVVLTGSRPNLPELVVGAHYDTAMGGTPGADDNASAVAALLEVARALAGKKPRRPLQLVFSERGESTYVA